MTLLLSEPDARVHARFDAKTDRSGSCWLWTGALTRPRKGYGVIRIDRVKVLAHRYAYERAFGPVPTGMLVLHRCDESRCVNPAHLFLGTQTDNMRDAAAKRRTHAPRGERHPLAKLRSEDVVEIRRRHSAGESDRVIAADYGIVPGHVWNLTRGAAWAE